MPRHSRRGLRRSPAIYRPALVLDRREVQSSRQPVALLGRVFCKAEASFGAIAAGDLLTTSSTRGHAMKASDRLQAFGAP